MIPLGVLAAATPRKGGGGEATDFIALLLARGAFMIFPHGEAGGSVAVNEGTGPDGSYSAPVLLGQPALYAGGPTSVRIDSGGRVVFPADSIPPMTTGVSMGTVVRISGATGFRPLVVRDDAGVGGGSRHWNFRLNGAGLEFTKITGSVEWGDRPHGMVAGDTAFLGCSYEVSTGLVRLYKNGVQLGSSIQMQLHANFAGVGPSGITVGNFHGYNAAPGGDRFSQSFVVPGVLSASDWAALAGYLGLG